MKKVLSIAMTISLGLGGQVVASGIGTICGFICDEDSGKAVAYAIVQIAGTTMGAQADRNGQFCLKCVPAGTHDMEATMCGYTTAKVTNIVVVADSVSFVDFAMEPDSSKYPCCMIVDGRDEFRVGETSSSKFIQSEQIRTFPATTIYELLRKRGVGTYR